MVETPAEPGSAGDETALDRGAGSARRRRLAIAVGAALVVVVVAVAIVLGNRSASDGGAAGPTTPAFPSDPSATSTPVTSQAPADGQAPPAAAPPVALDAAAEPVPGVVTTVGDLAAIEGVADGPGEVAGPALSFTVTVRNDTRAVVSLAAAVVTVASGSDLLPADQLATGSSPLPAEAGVGDTVTGTYVFTVPEERRDDVRITFDYLAGTPAVVFAGAAPRP
jgi:hypothetical protein